MKNLIAILIVAVLGAAPLAYAQTPAVVTSDKAGWQKIGETTVSLKKEKDEILVMGADRFASIKFRVTDEPIYLSSLEVYFESGDKQDVNVNIPLKLEGESREIDLKGGERNLKKIVMVYKTMPNSKKENAHVEMWGLKTNADKASTGK